MLGTMAEIRLFAGSFAPLNWTFCYGQLLPISQYQALFSLLGTYYGGDGRTTFGIPDFRGRMPVGTGSGPGLTPRSLGHTEGTQSNALHSSHLPSHSHTAAWTQTSGSASGVASGSFHLDVTPVALNDEGDQTSPQNNVPAKFTPGSGDAFGEFDASSPGDYANMHTLQGSGTLNASATSSDLTVGGATVVNNNGSSYSFQIVQPGLALQYILCMSGTFPSRN